ncbi:MAG: Hsp70 family protein [Candidatus Eisenbacteria bacterium]|uniref:Hsp70 family protein n=1 Tax=Eiseniibacteriota bacterium TaxID=2212470 RepID=A0A937XCZ9_UNCEI|nr:Hsp70 family protein [Candidatus Eisenbacteria bacterium]
MSAIIGIDFGCRTCRTAVLRKGKAEAFPNRHTERPQPIILDALDMTEGGGTACILPFRFRRLKQKLGSDQFIEGSSGPRSTADAVTEVFRQIVVDGRSALGEPVEKAVLAVPGFFPERARAALRDAALRAGVPAVKLYDEALGAVMGGARPAESGNTLVYAMGAGIFAVSVVQVREGGARVLSAAGDRFLGGDEFDSALVEVILDRLVIPRALEDLSGAMLRLKDLAESVKTGLSRREQEEFDVNLTDLFSQGGGVSMVITREDFERAIAGVVAMTLSSARGVVAEAGLAPQDLDRVLLVGGSTRVPIIERSLANAFAVPQVRAGDADIAVGAARQGGRLAEADWKRSDPVPAPPESGSAPAPPPARRSGQRAARPTPPPSSAWLDMLSAGVLEAEALWARGDLIAAIRALEKVLLQVSQFLGTLYQEAGQGLSREGRHGDAVVLLEKAVEFSPEDMLAQRAYHRALNQLAVALYRAQRFAEAEKAIQRALRINPKCPGCLDLAANIRREIRAARARTANFTSTRKRKKG